jgi:hypothetical protein
MVKLGPQRDWQLVAPWYRWARQRDVHGWRPRETRPVLQKYDTSDPVSEFLRDPQRSLRFRVDDEVHTLTPFPAAGNGSSRKRRLADAELVPTGLRKLFLPTHRRFYLVVCELRSDAPGFPCVHRDGACEAGFVVRRRTTAVPPAATKEATAILRELAWANAQLKHVAELATLTSPALGHTGGAGPTQLMATLQASVGEQLAAQRAEAEAGIAAQNAALKALVAEHGIEPVLQGWVPGPFDGIGAWQPVAEKPASTSEQVFPLHPLVPDPAAAQHCGQGHTIYFGLVPTGNGDADANGDARFDERELYEIRCFVRRHRPGCPQRSTRNDCSGELVWSAPTEPFRLAPHFDPVGTGNRPITIQLPDLPALAAHAAGAPVGANAAVRMVAPPESALRFRVEDMKPIAKAPGASICSFSIPLITIIATFVLNLFLPIVVFVFGLWWMLRLKFCIPPSIEVGAAVTAALELSKGGIDLDVDVGINFDFDPDPLITLTRGDIETQVRADFNAAFDTEIDGTSIGDGFVDAFTPGVLVTQSAELAHDFAADPAPDSGAGPGSGRYTANLEYEARVERGEKFA